MFLLIFEDGSIAKSKTVSDGDLEMADAGILDVIALGVDARPMEYYQGGWHEVETAQIATEH